MGVTFGIDSLGFSRRRIIAIARIEHSYRSSRSLLSFFVATLLQLSSVSASAVTYTSAPAIGAYSTGGIAIEMRITDTMNGTSPITFGNVRFWIRKSDGTNFTGATASVRRFDLYENGSIVGSVTPSTSVSVDYVDLPLTFTSGTRAYQFRKASDYNGIYTGLLYITATNPDTTPPSLSTPSAAVTASGVISGTFTASDSSSMPAVQVQLSRSQFSPSSCSASCAVNASPVSPTTAGGSGTYSFAASNAQCTGLTGLAGQQPVYVRSFARDASGNESCSGNNYVLDPGPVPVPVVTSITPTSVTQNVTLSFSVVGTSLPVSMQFSLNGCASSIYGFSNDGVSSYFVCKPTILGTFTPTIVDTNTGSPISYTGSPITVSSGPAISSVAANPAVPTAGQLLTINLTGSGFGSGMKLSFTGCVGVENITLGTSSYRSFSCTPTVSGRHLLVVRDASNVDVPPTLTAPWHVNVDPATTSGACGTAAGVATATRPSTNLCAVGDASTVTGSGPWSWTCTGTNNTPVPCAAPGATPAIASVSPTVARVDVLQNFLVAGTNLVGGMQFAMADCEGPNNACPEVGTGTSTQRTFQCTPRLPGTKTITVKSGPGGTVLKQLDGFVDNPARTGDASRRGIPAVAGVSLWNGNYHHEAVDMEVPGKGLSFVLSRAYNTYYWNYVSQRGGTDNYNPWRFNWDLRIGYVNGNTSHIFVQREDGSGDTFYKDTDGIWYPIEQGSFATLRGDTPTAGQTTVTLRSGRVYVFQNPDLGGKLLAVKDHDGHTLSVSYNASSKVGSVTDTVGRVFAFTYYANGQLQRVTDPTGRYVEYTWESDTAPNTGAARNRIKTVRDVRGFITTYNYTAFTSTDPAIGPRVFLTSIADPRGNTPVTLTYSDTVYGNWGVATARDAVGNTWGFGYCAVLTAGGCGGVSQATSFKTSVTAPLATSNYSVQFDTAGRYTGKTDGRGNTSAVTPYPTTGLTVRNYNWAGLTNNRRTAKGFQTSFGYDAAGNSNARTNPDNGVQTSTWTAGGSHNCWNLTQRQTPRGVASSMTYTATCKMETQSVAGLPASGNTYDPTTKLLTTSTDPLTNATNYGYDAQGNLTSVTDALGQITLYTSDALGRQTQKQDPRGVITRYTYNESGQVLTEAINPAGLNLVTSYRYDANGNNDQVIDPKGNITTMVYDAADLLTTTTRVVNAVNVSTTSVYDTLGRVTSTTNANNHAQSTAYDPNGNIASRSDSLPRTTAYTYDEDNRPLTIDDPENRRTSYSYAYTTTGRTETVTTPDGSVTRIYDLDGRLTSTTDKKGLVTSYGYDIAGRRNAVTDPTNVVTRMTYDANNNLKTVADPRGNVTTYNYDVLNRRTQVVDPKGRIWQTNYNTSGNVSSTSDPAGNTATYSYDLANRLVGMSWSDGSSVTYLLDKNGNRTSVTDGTGTMLFVYDALNRVTSVTDPNGQQITYGYDGMGNVTALGYPGGRQVTYRYDGVDRFYQLTDWGNRNTTYTLDRSDRVTRIAHGNGTVTTKGYDSAGRLNNLSVTKPDNSVIASWGLTRDSNGNIISATTQLPLQPSVTSSTVTRSYDTDNRQIGLPHDSAGRVTNTGAFALTWNAREQVTAINGQAQTYSTGGYRVAEVAGSVTTKFVTDVAGSMPNLLAEANSANVIQRYYVHSPYGLVQQVDAAGNPRYYHFDTNANAVAMTDASGQVTDSYAYTPFGEMTTNGNTPNPFRFAGEVGVRNFNNSPLFDMRARWYDASAGRFVSLDPLLGTSGQPQSLDRYAYVEGNPLVLVDPSGLAAATFPQMALDVITNIGPGIGEEAFVQLFGKPGADLRQRAIACANPSSTNWEGSRAYRYGMKAFELTTNAFGCLQLGATIADVASTATFYKNPALLTKIYMGGVINSMAGLTVEQKGEFKDWFGLIIDGVDVLHSWREIDNMVAQLSNKASTLRVPLRSSTYRALLKEINRAGRTTGSDSLKFILDAAARVGLLPTE